ncbi:hypothetical protein B8A32_06710 [Loigolactobacillus backii]|nr:hypothetical protein B8A32_06710 [Loigolactobacillus backii]
MSVFIKEGFIVLTQLINIIFNLESYLSPFLEHLGQSVYLILFILIFLETASLVFVFIPGQSFIFLASTLAASSASGLNIWRLLLDFLLAAFFGNIVKYYIGQHFYRHRAIQSNAQSRFGRAQRLLNNHGEQIVIFGRFIPILGNLIPTIAGATKMNPLHYLFYTAIGVLVWVDVIAALGFFLGRLPIVHHNLTWFLLGFFIISALPSLIKTGWDHWKRPATEHN